ncbi:MAG: NAD(P)H-dependent glycerol-3-phosphate dehydrogenase [Holosporaceae bacterium]|jgi:glycerol-3-phosphate dehydrogenase (NAD(P)+)|nr:NAD(P)H-dependent glycerol-3-phosphate dehydrogenase [Holosporaceae bacterium]
MVSYNKIGIVGAGCYGTAIARCFSSKAKEILLVSDVKIITSLINKFHANIKALCGTALSANVSCTDRFSDICDVDIVFVTVPTAATAKVFAQMAEYKIKAPAVLCSKGFDIENGCLQSDLFEKISGKNYAVFSGPSFAEEIADGLPAEVNIASPNGELSRKIAESLSSFVFKITPLDDYRGLQTIGALKNVLAVGCGIFSGLKLGNSAVARLITDGLKEAAKLIVLLGGKETTLAEAGGIGDVILTCAGRKSRNILFGEHLAAGGNVASWNGPLAEGASAAKMIPIFERKYDVRLKVFSGIYKAIYENRCLFEIVSEII